MSSYSWKLDKNAWHPHNATNATPFQTSNNFYVQYHCLVNILFISVGTVLLLILSVWQALYKLSPQVTKLLVYESLNHTGDLTPYCSKQASPIYHSGFVVSCSDLQLWYSAFKHCSWVCLNMVNNIASFTKLPSVYTGCKSSYSQEVLHQQNCEFVQLLGKLWLHNQKPWNVQNPQSVTS